MKHLFWIIALILFSSIASAAQFSKIVDFTTNVSWTTDNTYKYANIEDEARSTAFVTTTFNFAIPMPVWVYSDDFPGALSGWDRPSGSGGSACTTSSGRFSSPSNSDCQYRFGTGKLYANSEMYYEWDWFDDSFATAEDFNGWKTSETGYPDRFGANAPAGGSSYFLDYQGGRSKILGALTTSVWRRGGVHFNSTNTEACMDNYTGCGTNGTSPVNFFTTGIRALYVDNAVWLGDHFRVWNQSKVDSTLNILVLDPIEMGGSGTLVTLDWDSSGGTTVKASLDNRTSWTSLTDGVATLVNGGPSGHITLNISIGATSKFQGGFNLTLSSIDDATPAGITYCNGTSEGGLGFNVSSGTWQTNDTTPSVNCITNETATVAIIDLGANLNYTDIFKGNANFDGGAGTLSHINTLNDSNASRIGLQRFCVSAKDAFNNENRNCTFTFNVNITDPISPIVNISYPKNNSFFVSGVNDTNVKFNFSSTDNFHRNYSCSLSVNGVPVYQNSTYINGTEGIYIVSSMPPSGSWNVTCIDSFNNYGFSKTFVYSLLTQASDVGLYIDGINASSKYELFSAINISANSSCASCMVCIDLDAPGYGNYSCGTGSTSFLYNATLERQRNTTQGRSVTIAGGINVTLDNRTDMVSFAFNLTPSGSVSNINISYPRGGSLILRGIIVGTNIQKNEFIYAGQRTSAVNITYLVAGPQYVSINLSEIDQLIGNVTFKLTGYDLDNENALSYVERFANSTQQMNSSRSYNVSSSIPVVSLSYCTTDSGCALYPTIGSSYTLNRLGSCCSGGITRNFYYNDTLGDFNNTAQFNITADYYLYVQDCSSPNCDGGTAWFYIEATDGTNSVQIYSDEVVVGNLPGGGHNFHDRTMDFNASFKRQIDSTGADTNTWDFTLIGNYIGYASETPSTGTGTSTTSSTFSTSGLDSTKRIYLRFRLATAEGSSNPDFNPVLVRANWKKTQWGGAGLVYNTTNQAFPKKGNFTSTIVNVTATNVKRAVLSCADIEFLNSSIEYFISNTCNETNPVFERTFSGDMHTFATTGRVLCWRAVFENNDTAYSPLVKRCTISVIPATAQNISVDFGDDGTIDFNRSGPLNSSNSPVNISVSTNTLTSTLVKITSGTIGQIQFSDLNVTTPLNPIELDESRFENCNLCEMNISSTGGGSLVFSGLEADFKGSWNYTAIARAYSEINLLESTRHFINLRYSKFNYSLPAGIEYYDVFARFQTQRNLTPNGQKPSTPFWNVTSGAYQEPFDLYVKLENITSPCLNQTWSNTSDRTRGFNLTDRFKLACPSVSPFSSSCNLWNFIDLKSCSSRVEYPIFQFAAHCTNCTLDLNDFDNYEILTG
jgi:hypothetical protein